LIVENDSRFRFSIITANVRRLAEVVNYGSQNFRFNTDFASTKPTLN